MISDMVRIQTDLIGLVILFLKHFTTFVKRVGLIYKITSLLTVKSNDGLLITCSHVKKYSHAT